MTGVRVAGDHYVLDGTEDAPVQIDCDDMQLSADHMEYFQNEGRVDGAGERRVHIRRQPDHRRADGVQHEDADRRVLRGVWHGDSAAEGHPGASANKSRT